VCRSGGQDVGHFVSRCDARRKKSAGEKASPRCALDELGRLFDGPRCVAPHLIARRTDDISFRVQAPMAPIPSPATSDRARESQPETLCNHRVPRKTQSRAPLVQTRVRRCTHTHAHTRTCPPPSSTGHSKDAHCPYSAGVRPSLTIPGLCSPSLQTGMTQLVRLSSLPAPRWPSLTSRIPSSSCSHDYSESRRWCGFAARR